MRYKRHAHHQPPLKGGRDPLFSCVLPSIRAAAVKKAREFGVSPSWVVATILAKAFGIEEQVDFQTLRKPGERK